MGKNNLEYNFDTAFHYKAYRPPLHTIILDNCIGNLLFEKALDVGCGLGHSSIALTNFCDKVIGYDPSEPMIQQAKKHERVNYLSNLKYLKSAILTSWSTMPAYLGAHRSTSFPSWAGIR